MIDSDVKSDIRVLEVCINDLHDRITELEKKVVCNTKDLNELRGV